MKPLVTTLFVFLFLFSKAQDYKTFVKQADAYYNQKNYAESIAMFQQAFALEKKNPEHLYNAACSAALSGNKDLAFEWLNLAADNGWYNLRHLQNDSDLSSLNDSEQWNSLIAKIQKEVDRIESKMDKPLRDQLLKIFEEDQGIRHEYIAAIEKYGQKSVQLDSIAEIMIYKDSINLIAITNILDTKGWVGADKVGGQANQTIFLVIQHADLKTQQKYLPMMRDAVTNNNANKSSLALLEDRVALGEGKRQIYGSQIGFDEETNAYYVLPLEDPLHVDERRATMELGTISDYVGRWNIEWDAEQYLKLLPELEKKQNRD